MPNKTRTKELLLDALRLWLMLMVVLAILVFFTGNDFSGEQMLSGWGGLL